jgi:hypothetical protein
MRRLFVTLTTQQASARSFTISFAALAALFVITFASQLTDGSLPPWAQGQVDAHRVLWPQRWQFFAAGAGEQDVVVYRLDEDGTPGDQVPPAFNSASNRWGLSRHEYAVFDQIFELDRAIPAGAWRNCPTGALATCPLPGPAVVRFAPDEYRGSSVCGQLLFTHEAPATRAVVELTSVSAECPP